VSAHDVVFVGTLWQERIDLLVAVDWSGIDLGLYGSADLFDQDRFPSPHNARQRTLLEPYLHIGFIDNERTTALYRAAKLGLNLHRTSVDLASGQHVQGAESMNPRCYEQAATGGALLVTDARQEVYETFGEAAAVFDGPEQLEDLVRTLLYDDHARQQRTDALRIAVTPHTFAARAAQMTAELSAAKGA
jgi:spore maturation protein CgeB